ncbi:MAG: DUF1684 domain-containing protein [Bacteroidetes bacterium]|nr:DUF1684 domain-containing protein [Bacteroidota bacterium]
MNRFILLFYICVLPLLMISCGSDDESDTSGYIEFDSHAIQTARKEKDKFFKTDPHSPLIPEQRASFNGLRYFMPSEDYYVNAAFEQAETPDTLMMLTSKQNDKRYYLRYGFFTFSIGDSSYKLTAFKPIGQATGTLFVPFKDETNGKQTYSAGRYLDIEEDVGANEYTLDFNAAYNPYCAYNYGYSCPIVPAENVLHVNIKAGEKKPTDE